jgi:hypothetical protein
VLTNDVISFRNNSGVVPAAARVARTTNIAHPGSNVAYTWSSALLDTATMFSAGTPNRLTVGTAGIYQVNAIAYVSNTTTYTTAPTLRLYVNGSVVAAQGMVYQNGGFVSTTATISTVLSLAATDYIQLTNSFGGGGSLLIYGDLGNGYTEMSCIMLGATS